MVFFKDVALRVGRIALQMMVLVFFAGNLALSINAWRSKPLPLLAAWSPQTHSALPKGDAPTIPLGCSPTDTRPLA